MSRYTLVYGVRLIPEGTLKGVDDAKLKLADGSDAGLTLHTFDGTIPQLRRALDRSLDAFFDLLQPPNYRPDQRRMIGAVRPIHHCLCQPLIVFSQPHEPPRYHINCICQLSLTLLELASALRRRRSKQAVMFLELLKPYTESLKS